MSELNVKINTKMNLLNDGVIEELEMIMKNATIDTNLVDIVTEKIRELSREKVEMIVEISKLVNKIMLRSIGKKHLSMEQLFTLVETNTNLVNMLTPEQRKLAAIPTFTKHDYSRIEKLDPLDAIKVIKSAIKEIGEDFAPDREKLRNNAILDIMALTLSMDDQGYDIAFDEEYDFVQILEDVDGNKRIIEVTCHVNDGDLTNINSLVLTEPFKYLRREFAKTAELKRNRGH